MAKRTNSLALILWLGAAACVVGGGYLVFDLGRLSGGFSLLDTRRISAENAATIGEQAAEIENLQRQVAILETARAVDRETYSQVEENLARLEARIQTQNEELAFYQGIVSPEDGASGLRVQSLEIEPGGDEGRYLLRLVLVQAIVHSKNVKGSVKLAISGLADGREAEYDSAALAAEGESGSIGYDFRYFQTIERQVVLPEGFLARTVKLEVRPAEPRGDLIERSYQWVAAKG